jgi:hypothetical protein
MLRGVKGSKAVTAQIYLITGTVPVEVGRCEILFSYWPAKINIMKESATLNL